MQSSIDARDLALFHAKKAFDLRDRVTQAERFNINIMFYTVVNGDLEKAIGEAGLYSRTYRDSPSIPGRRGSSSPIGMGVLASQSI